MSTFQTLYPQANQETLAVTITLATLASSSSLLSGREATPVDNRSNLDLDHILSGKIRTGAAPSGGRVEVWAFAARQILSDGSLDWGQAQGTDANLTLNGDNVKLSGWLKPVASFAVDAAANRTFDFSGISVALLFGGWLPPLWSLWVTQSSGDALSTGSSIWYQRVRLQA